MRTTTVFMLLLFSLNCLAHQAREWRSRDGTQSFTGTYVALKNKKDVELLGKERQRVKVPLARLSPEDQEYIFQLERRTALGAVPGNIRGLRYARGELLGPLAAEDGSSFFLYAPKSLPRDRSVPMMLFTGPTGGKRRHLRELMQGAEVVGWIVAVAIESDYYNSVDVNRSICDSIVQTIMQSAPVDRRRLYFAGFSAGASVSYYNGDKWKACGLIPTSTYMPPRLDPPSCDTVIISGAKDFNRYTSAYARRQIGERAVHWFHAEGHQTAPPWMMHDAMALLEAKFLGRDRKNNARELERYIYSMIEWIGGFSEKDPHRAYYWARYLKSAFQLDALQLMKIDPLVEKLGQNELNRLYVAGLDELDQLSLTFLGKLTKESKLNFSDPSLASKCAPLLRKHQNTPVIKEVLNALCSRTDEPACKQPHWE